MHFLWQMEMQDIIREISQRRREGKGGAELFN